MRIARSQNARLAGVVLSAFLWPSVLCDAADAKRYSSHPPMRPLPAPSSPKLGPGPTYFVDAEKGDDANDGSEQNPWKTVNHALGRLEPGDTLCLRGGTYYEDVTVGVSGTPGRPITIRSYPGELAVLDGGYREFFDEPQHAWEPVPDGAKGEFRSVKPYPELAAGPDAKFPVFAGGVYAEEVRVLGNFADSMVPLHGYAMAGDLRAESAYWTVKDKLDKETGVYCGPGVWLNPDTKRIHVRLARMNIPAFGDHNYRGETDPRKLPLVIGGAGVVLFLDRAKHVRIHGLVVRGTRSHTVNVTGARDVEFDHLTVYGGCPAVYVRHTAGLRLVHCALRGVAAPWSTRSTIKYRGNASYLFIADGKSPPNCDFDMGYSELTDCHDGVVIGTIKGLKFHHNLVDNFNDDGLYLTLWRDAPGEDICISQNRISRCLSSLAFAQLGEGIRNAIGPPVHICRNVFDLREPVHYGHPQDAQYRYTSEGRIGGDHGSPIWDPMYFYHNTMIVQTSKALFGLTNHTRDSSRRVFNNVILQVGGMPGLGFPPPDQDFQSDGNLYWSVSDGPAFDGGFFAAFRNSPKFQESKKRYAPGFTANDRFGDPKFVALNPDWRKPSDLRLRADSPAVNAGIPIPKDWPDPVRQQDRGRPDIGALPRDIEPWGIGVDGRLSLFSGRTR